MDDSQRLHLQKMIRENNVEDFTGDIKTKKHSDSIRENVTKLIQLKKKYARLCKSNHNEYEQILKSQCSFLYDNYTDIYNRVKNDELDLGILWKLVDLLKTIENGENNQHEASYEVGKLLKSLYIDSAVRHADKINAKNAKNARNAKNAPKETTGKKLSWKQFKESNLKNN